SVKVNKVLLTQQGEEAARRGAHVELAVELDRSLGHQEPPWKEFRFDLTQIPAGEAVTAAEFRIYKLPSTHLLNRTLHVSMFEVVRERANRESDLFFLDLQTLRAEDEGWLVLDVTAASDHGLLNRSRDLGLRLYVETEDGKAGGRQRTSSRALVRGPGCTPALQLSDWDFGRLLTLQAFVLSPVEGGFRPSSIHQVFRGGASCIPGSGHRKPKVGPDPV
ncbi:bone morphogenetic protein 8B-like, partial [Myotis lucifugus]|uniref:bone morphogenetic protein 8B-like n=1 Tax=Myotis lucifugus TaxID=59463 RepID=UPI000CCC1AFC